MSDFFKELKRRNVFKVAAVYAVVSWLILQLADVLLENFGIPDWGFRFITILLALGFPIALVFAWAFEVTPEGIKKEKDIDRSKSITTETGQKLNYSIIGLLVLAVAYFAVDKFLLRTGGDDTEVAADASQPSIAVLPFASMSSDPENEHFSDGLSEELLNMLAHIDELKVAGRTSSFYFKGRNEDLTEIGEKLGVNHVLEGSVRKSGDRVRVTAQLIAVEDGFHLWSDTYDAELDDIFAIQEEIARAVADAMKITLLGEEDAQLSERSTESGEAHSVYLVARTRMRERGLENLRQARELFEKAVEIDPRFAPAWSGLADTVMLLHGNHLDLGLEQSQEMATEAIARALEINPDLSEAWASRGLRYRMRYLRKSADDADLVAAVSAFERAIELNENYAEAWHWYGLLVGGEQNNIEGALELLDRALELDPLARNPQLQYGNQLQRLGRLNEARERYLYLIDLYPDYGSAYHQLGHLEEDAGRLDQAVRWLERALELDDEARLHQDLAWLYAALGDMETAEVYRDRLASNEQLGWIMPSISARLAGDYRTELELLEEARARLDEGLWANYVAWVAAYAGDLDKAEAYLELELPGFAEAGPAAVNQVNIDEAVLLAFVRQGQGRTDEARALLESALAAAKLPETLRPNSWERMQRMTVLAMLARVDQALDEFRLAVDAGYRSVYSPGFGRYLRIDKDLLLTNLHNELRFIAMLQEIETDNARARRRLESGEVPIL